MPNDLVGIIKAKQSEIARLQAELDEALSLLAGRADAVSHVALRSPAAPPKGRLKKKGEGADTRGADTLLPDSAAAWAADSIRSAGRPLHITVMLKAIEQAGHKVKQNTLVGALSRWVARKAIFYRSGKNTFGLIEMRKK